MDLSDYSDEDLRKLLTAAVAEYSQRVQTAVDDGAEAMAALDTKGGLTATDVVIAADHMLDAFDIAAFELAALRYAARPSGLAR